MVTDTPIAHIVGGLSYQRHDVSKIYLDIAKLPTYKRYIFSTLIPVWGRLNDVFTLTIVIINEIFTCDTSKKTCDGRMAAINCASDADINGGN